MLQSAHAIECTLSGSTPRRPSHSSLFWRLLGVKTTLSSSSNGVYLGNACGIILRAEGGKTLYPMGDTEVFGDMALINRRQMPLLPK